MFKTLIIDDEPSARQNVKSLIEKHRPMDLIHEAQNTDEALRLIGQHAPQLMFLDIEMPGETGIGLLRKIHENHPEIQVVFVTAFSHYAIEAIKCEAFDYILKPVDEDEFIKTLARLEQKLQGIEPKTGNNLDKLIQHFEASTLKISTKRGIDLIEIDDIVYLEAKSNYTQLVLHGKAPQLVSQTLGKLESRLTGCNFLRVGRSYIINKKYLLGTDRVSKQVKLLAGDIPIILSVSLNEIRKLEKQL
jgi:two-component system LytT family response regulator